MLYYRENFIKLGVPPLQMTTGETTLGRARTVVEIERQRHINRHLGIPDDQVFGRKRAGRTLREVVSEYLERETPKKRPGTQAQDTYYLDELVKGLGHLPIAAIDTRTVDDWLRAERRRRKRTTYFDFVKKLNLILGYALSEKYIASRPQIRNPDEKKAEFGRAYTRREIKALWRAMKKRLRLRDQFVLAYECMMRKGEILGLEWSRVNLATGEITLRAQDVKTGSKTGRGRKFIVSPHALRRLRKRAENRKPSRFVFPHRFDMDQPQLDLRAAWAAAKRSAKPRITGSARWYDLRHTGITDALVAGANVFDLAEYCGTSVRMIQRVYAHLKAQHTSRVSRAVRIGGEE